MLKKSSKTEDDFFLGAVANLEKFLILWYNYLCKPDKGIHIL